jgi:lysophospholipase L1-like esterase
MLDCLIIGDSIAVGTHQFRPECVAYAQGGITSHGWNKKFGSNDLTAESVIISLSTNDWEKADTYGMLMNIRTKIKGKRVFWVEPNRESKFEAVQHVRKVAEQFGDTVIVTTRWQKDHIHPSWAGYKNIAEKTK